MDNVIKVDSNHSVALFAPDQAALRQAAEAGFRTIVNFRTAEEKQDVSPVEEHRIVEKAGVNYLHFPVAADELDNEMVDDFRRYLDDLAGPILLHCATGKRAGAMTLMALAADKGLDGDDALELGRKTGIDLSDEQIGQFVKAYADNKANV